MEAYCVKCKTKRDMQNPERVVLKNGRPAMKGTCPVCGTKLLRFVKKGA
jgi:DNA polymerase II large subunit